MGATAQRRYLEGKYPSQPIYSQDLYATIKKFQPTAKSLSNDAAQMSDWLDEQKERDSRWIIARGWDDDNTLTHLLWMTLEQDYPQSKTYLEGLYTSKEYWAHSYTSFRFTGGMIATSRVESVNACIKRMLFNSDVSLCELMSEIHKLLDEQDKKNIYQYWKLAIPSVKNQEHANFLFTEVDKYCQRFLTPAILKLQRDEINQSLYYAANPINEQDIVVINEVSYDDECAESPRATIEQLIEVSGRDNVKEIWAVRVGNSLIAKHYVILLKNDAHMCSCLMVIQKGVVCRHYFQVMLNTCKARFHIRLIPSRWYQKDKDASHEAFIVADKFQNGMSTNAIQENNVGYLCAIDKEKEDLLEHWMNLLDEKIMYGTLHGTYKKALRKALQTKTDSLRLIEILEDFANEDSEFESEDERLGEEEFDESDKENINPFQLENPKIRRGKGRPAGTRRYKASNEKD
ncbi:unnamed protein product [Rhizophagus irregularis]|nr:unnamed protein product [Rhizophagus irregularis]